MIHATVLGRLGADAEVRDAGGQTVMKMRIAASYKPKKDVEHTTWIGCDLWGTRGVNLAPHLKKGDQVLVRGTLFTREHDGKMYVDMRVDELEFAGSKKDDASNGASKYGTSGHGASAKHTLPAEQSFDEDDPFKDVQYKDAGG
jgi:single-strand DNA-binding protein